MLRNTSGVGSDAAGIWDRGPIQIGTSAASEFFPRSSPSALTKSRTGELNSPSFVPGLPTISNISTMASKLPTRSFRAVYCSARRPAACPNSILPAAVVQRRELSTPTSTEEGTQAAQTNKPRWSYTPPAAKAPFSLRFNSRRPEFHVNEDPTVLDQFYIRMLGNGGDKMLSEEVKWLAVTHKSFDQGRRGFNDRLAFLGMLEKAHCKFSLRRHFFY